MPGALYLGVGGTTCRKRRSESRGLSHSLRAASVSPSHLLGMPGFVLLVFGSCVCCLCFVKAFPASLNEMPNYGTLFKTATIVMVLREQKKKLSCGNRSQKVQALV